MIAANDSMEIAPRISQKEKTLPAGEAATGELPNSPAQCIKPLYFRRDFAPVLFALIHVAGRGIPLTCAAPELSRPPPHTCGRLR